MTMKAVKLAYLYARFSDPRQTDGDSLRRQTALAERWCEANGYRLDESTTYRDKGVSGFRGKHRTTGALSAFLSEVRQGNIPSGSVLLIENIDRLSREAPWDFITLLNELVQAGVRVVQLDTGEALDKSADLFVLMKLLMTQHRGHDESKKKSDRVGANWNQWRETGESKSGTIRPGPVPFWITRKPKSDVYVLDETAAAHVRMMIGWAIDGWGAVRIHKELRRRKLKVIDKDTSDGFISPIYLRNVFRNPVLYGRCEELDRDDYFPAVITRDEFYRLQAATEARTRKGKTRQRDRVYLVSGLLENYDTGRNYISRRWPGTDRHNYFPYDVRYGNDTDTTSFPVEALETAVLDCVRELDPAVVLGDTKRANQMTGLLAEAEGIKTRITTLEAAMETGTEDEAKSAVKVVGKLEGRLRDVNAKIAEERAKLATPVIETITAAQRMIALDTNDDEVRLRLRTALGNVIDRIRVSFKAEGVWRMAFATIHFRNAEYVREVYVLYHRPLAGVVPEFFFSDAGRLDADAEFSTPETAFGYLRDIRTRVEAERKEAWKKKRAAYLAKWGKTRPKRDRSKKNKAG